MHHKRGRPKNRRAGCLLCKPNKMNGAGKREKEVQKVGFGKLRAEEHARSDLGPMARIRQGLQEAIAHARGEDIRANVYAPHAVERLTLVDRDPENG